MQASPEAVYFKRSPNKFFLTTRALFFRSRGGGGGRGLGPERAQKVSRARNAEEAPQRLLLLQPGEEAEVS